MSKMGHKEGLGLGLNNQGISGPIELDSIQKREGLGYGSTSFDRFHSIVKIIECKLHGFTTDEIKKWKIKQGPIIPVVFVTRYCGNTSSQTLSQLYENRTNLGNILKNKQKLSELSQNFWPSAISDHMSYVSHDALIFAVLDHHSEITRELRINSTPIKFANLGEGGGVIEYLLEKMKGKTISGLSKKEFDILGSKKISGDDLVTPGVVPIKVVPEFSELLVNCQIEKAIEVIEDFAGKYKNGQGLNLLIGDLVVKEKEEEQTFNQQLLSEILIGLCSLQKQGTMVCRTWSNHRTSEIGLLYILYRSFKKIYYVKPFTSSPVIPERFLVCQNLISRPPESLVNFLKDVNSKIGDLKGSKFDVLEVVPPPVCLNSQLREIVALANAELVQREIFGLQCLEKEIGKMMPGEIREQVGKIFNEWEKNEK